MTTAPLETIPVGVIVERRRARSFWADASWRPVTVLPGHPDVAPWTQLEGNDEAALIYLGPAHVRMFRSEAANYRTNLHSGQPTLWVALTEGSAQRPYEIAVVTADPAEAESLSDLPNVIVEGAPMPPLVAARVTRFVDLHFVDRPFEKRRNRRWSENMT